MEQTESLANKYLAIRPYRNERHWRLLLAADARFFGRGGVTLVSKASGIPRATIHIGLKELDSPPAEIDPTASRRSYFNTLGTAFSKCFSRQSYSSCKRTQHDLAEQKPILLSSLFPVDFWLHQGDFALTSDQSGASADQIGETS